MGIELTSEAAQELRRIIKERELDEGRALLRVGIEGSDAGRSYALDLTEHAEPGAEHFMSHGISVVCAREQAEELDGARVDFRSEPAVESTFVVDFPAEDPELRIGDLARLPTEDEVRRVLRLVDDPEVGLNIVDLGLVYGIEMAASTVKITMTLTTPACPLGDMITEEINYQMAQRWPAVRSVDVAIVWDPPWSPYAISTEGKMHLGWSL